MGKSMFVISLDELFIKNDYSYEASFQFPQMGMFYALLTSELTE